MASVDIYQMTTKDTNHKVAPVTIFDAVVNPLNKKTLDQEFEDMVGAVDESVAVDDADATLVTTALRKTEQVLTLAEKKQARTNINAADADDLIQLSEIVSENKTNTDAKLSELGSKVIQEFNIDVATKSFLNIPIPKIVGMRFQTVLECENISNITVLTAYIRSESSNRNISYDIIREQNRIIIPAKYTEEDLTNGHDTFRIYFNEVVSTAKVNIVFTPISPYLKELFDEFDIKFDKQETEISSIKEDIKELEQTALKKEVVKSANLFNYKEPTYIGKTINDEGNIISNEVFNTVAIPLEPGKTYIKYIGNTKDSWLNANVRVFDNTGKLLIKVTNDIVVPSDAINPIGYFAYYNDNSDLALDVKNAMVLESSVMPTEYIPYYVEEINDETLISLIEKIGGGQSYRFAERPSNGYENFVVNVNCSIADNTTTSDSVQDDKDIKQDRCILALPVNYSRIGEPVRLVICGHGTGWKCTASTTMPWAGMNTQLLLNEGYAVLGCNGTPGELDGLDQGHNCVPECYRSILAAYKYVIEKYNIKRDGVLTAGLSMGTYMTGQIALFTEIPVLAQVFYSFSGEIWKAQYTFKPTVRQRMCEKFGFTGIAPTFTTNNPPSVEEQEYIKSNMDKWSGYNLLVKGLTNKNILSLYDVWVASSVITSEQEAKLYNDAIVVGRPPCKFFICKNDTTSPKRWSEYMTKMIRNGGGYAELRYYETGGHNSWGAGEDITISTKYGGNMTVNGSSYEGLLFLQKFDK